MAKVSLQKLGVETGYRSATGTWNEANAAAPRKDERAKVPAMKKVRVALRDVWVINQGDSRPLGEPSILHPEDGTSSEVRGYLTRDLPLGYHQLESLATGERTRVIVTPAQCYLPEDLSTWGWA